MNLDGESRACAIAPVAVVPDHELLHPIAAGAYGEVWLARNALGTLRAVKIVRREFHTCVETFEREFKGLQKFEPVSRTHEGLVDILAVGLLPSRAGFYYVMELADQATARSNLANIIEGASDSQKFGSSTHPSLGSLCVGTYEPRTLRTILKDRSSLPAQDVIGLGLKLTAALAHLHGQGLVHRDVKPSNLLYIDGEPKLADAGLVAAVDDARSLVGTAGYIAPEGPGSVQADLYALGKVLYEAAFGRDRQDFPTLPVDVAARADHSRLLELNAILLKACAEDRRHRYQSADHMLEDLKLAYAGCSVRRRQAWQKWGLRGAKFAAVAGVIAALAVVPALLARRGSPNSQTVALSKSDEANDAYQDGVVWFHKNTTEGIKRSISCFQRAIEIDPQFAHAHAALAYSYAWGSAALGDWELLRNGRQEGAKALALDRSLGEAHWPIGCAMALLDLDWNGADREYQMALQLSPNSPDVLYQYANYLVWANRINEATIPIEKALRADSQSVAHLQNASWLLLATKQYDRAIRKAEEVVEKEPSTRANVTWGFLVPAYYAKGDFLKAIELCESSDLLSDENQSDVQQRYRQLREAYKRKGPVGYWEQLLTSLDPDQTSRVNMAGLYARVGNKDQAFLCLEETFEKAPTDLAFSITWDPALDNLRTDKRFVELLKKLRLAE